MSNVYGYVYGINDVTPVSTPTLTVVDNEDGTATFTVSGSTAGATNTVHTRRMNASSTESWASAGSRVGDGGIASVSLKVGLYYSYVTSEGDENQVAISDIVHFEIIDPNARPFTEHRLIAFDLQGVPVIYRQRTGRSVSASGAITNTFTETTIARALIAPVTADEVEVSNGRYKIGDWRVRFKTTDLPEEPPTLNSRLEFNNVEYQIFRYYQSADRLVWDIFCREVE